MIGICEKRIAAEGDFRTIVDALTIGIVMENIRSKLIFNQIGEPIAISCGLDEWLNSS